MTKSLDYERSKHEKAGAAASALEKKSKEAFEDHSNSLVEKSHTHGHVHIPEAAAPPAPKKPAGESSWLNPPSFSWAEKKAENVKPPLSALQMDDETAQAHDHSSQTDDNDSWYASRRLGMKAPTPPVAAAGPDDVLSKKERNADIENNANNEKRPPPTLKQRIKAGENFDGVSPSASCGKACTARLDLITHMGGCQTLSYVCQRVNGDEDMDLVILKQLDSYSHFMYIALACYGLFSGLMFLLTISLIFSVVTRRHGKKDFWYSVFMRFLCPCFTETKSAKRRRTRGEVAPVGGDATLLAEGAHAAPSAVAEADEDMDEFVETTELSISQNFSRASKQGLLKEWSKSTDGELESLVDVNERGRYQE